MILTDLITSPAFLRASVVGVFGGAGLALTVVFSRRGPTIFPVYAAILAALALLLTRYPDIQFGARFAAALGGFLVASAALYVTNVILAGRERRRLVAEGRLPESALASHVPIGAHAWRLAFLAAIGAVVSVGVAFIAA